jgi:UDP-N-acetylmuramyl tripeptide synthase
MDQSTYRTSIGDSLAAFGARRAASIIRAIGAGAGTTLPGRLADRVRPGLLARRAARLPGGVVVVSGTNGKTTTAAMIAAMLEASGAPVVTNASGANMTGGVVGAFIASRAQDASTAVLEIDEGALPALTGRLRPRLLVLTNVFRDQLDRFGEPERVTGLLKEAAEALPASAHVIANADDPLLWHAVRWAEPTGFGLSLNEAAGDATAPADAEPGICPVCGEPLTYVRRTIAHLGRAQCRACAWASSRPSVRGNVVAQAGVRGMVIESNGAIVTLRLGGLHNAYNAMAALAAADALGICRSTALAALERFTPRFGRAEEFEVDGRKLWLTLMKNPAGAGATARAVATDRDLGAVVICVNDRDADGRDVSWIWDADFERLIATGRPLVASGSRAEEVALRLKYAGALACPEPDPVEAITVAASLCAPGRVVAVLATYTAMLEIRRGLLGGRAARVEQQPPRPAWAA